MNILVLDDNELVIKAPEDYFVDPHDYRTDTIVQVACPDTFWSEYSKREFWHQIWLDHDLGHHDYSGRTVTMRFYTEGPVHQDRVGVFYVITNNPGTAKTMESDLFYTGVPVVRFPQSSLIRHGIHRGKVIFLDERSEPVIHQPKG